MFLLCIAHEYHNNLSKFVEKSIFEILVTLSINMLINSDDMTL